MRTLAASALWTAVLACGALCAQGQTPPDGATPIQTPAAGQSATAGQVPLLSSNVDEVSVDLVVHDKKHKLVTDLQAGDIAVADDGAPVKVTGFRLISEGMGSGNLVVLVFNSMEGPSAKRSEQIAERVLDGLGQKGFSYAVLDVSGRLRLMQRFTSNRNELLQAVKTATSGQDRQKTEATKVAEEELIAVAHTGINPAGHHATAAERGQAQLLLAALEGSQKIAQNQHTRPSLAGLLALSQSMERATERKAIIYFAQGPPLDSSAKAMVQTISGAASKAAVSIYTFDMNAYGGGTRYQEDNAMLNGPAPFNPAPIPVGGGNGYTATVIPQQEQLPSGIQGTPSAQGPVWGQSQDIQMMTDFTRQKVDNPFAPKSPLADLATGTGGGYIDPEDNLKKILAQMHQDLTTYYQLTYAAPVQDYDGKYRAISVRPLRAGLSIRHKEGYFSVPQGDEGVIQPFEAPLLKMLEEPQLPAELKFNAGVLQLGELPDGNANSLVMEAPLGTLEIRQDARTNLYVARVSMMAQIRDKNGAIVEHFSEDIVRHGSLEELEKAKQGAVAMQRHFYAEPGKYVLETAILDRNSGQKSAERKNFTISAAAQTGPALSDMILVRQMDKVDESGDLTEPLRYEDGKVTPNLSGQLSADDKTVSVFFILHPDANSASPPKLEMTVERPGHEGKRVAMPLKVTSNGGAEQYLATFKTTALRPGTYEVKAILTQGDKAVERAAVFNIGGPQLLAEAAGAPGIGHGGGPAATDLSVNVTAGSDDALPMGLLAIAVPAHPVPAPSQAEIDSLIAEARQRAVGYADSLPNFICLQLTNRSKDPSGGTRWQHLDTIAETLTYKDKSEERKIVAVDGKPSNGEREGMKIGVFSTGELGGDLRAVFADSAQAQFTWKETDTLGDGKVQVFSYRVAKANSMFHVTASNNDDIAVGYHGEVYIDSATRSVRRLTVVADDIPAKFPTHSTSITVDYDYVLINAHDFLMPVSAAVSLRQGRSEALLNTMEFRNYRKFGSESRILAVPAEGDAAPAGKQ
jgi:VWFA-related protein